MSENNENIPVFKPQPRFDPQTGQPLTQEVPDPSAPAYRFDPQTGRPLTSQPAVTTPQYRFDPRTGRPINPPGMTQPVAGSYASGQYDVISPDPTPYDYETIRKRYQAVKDVQKKVKKRYNLACALPMIECMITCLATIIMVFIFFGPGSAFARNGDMLKASNILTEYGYGVTGLFIVPAGIILLIIFMGISKVGRLRDWFPRKSFGPLLFILGILFAFGYSCGLNLLLNVIGSMGSDNGMVEPSFKALYSYESSLPPFLQITGTVYLCLMAPILEEILYRGYVLNMCSHVSRKFAVIASTLMFCLMHLNIGQVFTVFLLGFMCAYVDLKAHSILPSIFMHIVYNTTSYVIDYIRYSAYDEATLMIMNAFLGLGFVVGIIGTVVLFMRYHMTDERTDGMKCNPFFTDEEKKLLPSIKPSLLTASGFFGSLTFWGVCGIFVANYVVVAILVVVLTAI